MSAFDRIQGYSAKRGINETSSVFDVKTPEGAFLNRIHNEGYKMYEEGYALKEEYHLNTDDLRGVTKEGLKSYEDSLFISESAYNNLNEGLKSHYVKTIRYYSRKN